MSPPSQRRKILIHSYPINILMETSLLLAEKIAQLTLIVLMGIALVKFKLLKPADSYPLSVITLYLISPAVMIHAFQVDYTPEILDGLWLSVKLALLFNFSLIVLGKLLAKIFKLDILEQAAVIYTNAGNLIIPVVLAVFGAEWLIYTAGYLIVQTVLFWTHLRVMFAGRSQMSVKKIFTNVNILSIAVGLFMFAFQIKLPSVVDNALANVGSMIGPVAMMIAGMLIASLPLKEIIASKRIYLVTFLRLILMPLVLLVMIKLFGLAEQNSHNQTVVLISFLATISSSAATVTQMAVLYQKNPQKASAIYGITTLLCVVSMPLMIALYQWVM